jgi:hypothetical protein
MIPHPTTMSFAWEEDVLRCSRVLVSVFVLAFIGIIAVGAGLAMLTAAGNPDFLTPADQLMTGAEASLRVTSIR